MTVPKINPTIDVSERKPVKQLLRKHPIYIYEHEKKIKIDKVFKTRLVNLKHYESNDLNISAYTLK